MSADSVTAPFGRLFDFKEAMAYLGMPEKRLRRLVLAKKIPVIRDGRLAFLEKDLRDWIQRHRTPALDEPKSTHLELPKSSAAAPPGIADLMPRRRRFSRAS